MPYNISQYTHYKVRHHFLFRLRSSAELFALQQASRKVYICGEIIYVHIIEILLHILADNRLTENLLSIHFVFEICVLFFYLF